MYVPQTMHLRKIFYPMKHPIRLCQHSIVHPYLCICMYKPHRVSYTLRLMHLLGWYCFLYSLNISCRGHKNGIREYATQMEIHRYRCTVVLLVFLVVCKCVSTTVTYATMVNVQLLPHYAFHLFHSDELKLNSVRWTDRFCYISLRAKHSALMGAINQHTHNSQ